MEESCEQSLAVPSRPSLSQGENIKGGGSTTTFFSISVADPDPGSGIRCLFDPWIPDLGSRIPRPYFEELFDNFFW